MICYVDCVGGVAGDMLLAALLDAGASLEAVRAGLPVDGVELAVERVERRGVPATLLSVRTVPDPPHRTWRDVRALLDARPLPARAAERAHATFARLAEAEGRVHGVAADDVTFHEVGALDAIADVCGTALALEDLGVDEVACSPLPLGRGVTRGAHGLLPLPAPATVELLRGVPVVGSEAPGETVTPTGAALVRALAGRFGPLPAMRLDRAGTGAGRRDPEQVPNVVRVLLGTVEPTLTSGEAPLLLQTNLDDLLPELLPDAVDACFAAGALDVWTAPAGMKHGRPGFVLSALVPAAAERAVAVAVLRHTSALGVRVLATWRRWTLERAFRTVEVAGRPVRVKLGLLDGEVVNIAPEHRDCARVARETGGTAQAVWAAALAAAHD